MYSGKTLSVMPSGYRRELAGLDRVYRAVREMDVAPLCAVVEGWADSPMVMVGSGGSFSTATLAADLHESATGHLARAATPLDVISKPIRDAGLVCFSASGRNQDILAAFRVAATREMEPLSAFVLAEQTPLEKLGTKYCYADVVCLGHRLFRDGFLAVASLVASAILLVRAYRAVFGSSDTDIPNGVLDLIQKITSFSRLEDIRTDAANVMQGRSYVSVLYSSELTAPAVDIESRFVEAALGALHISDMRNFGHGRHFWMARRAAKTGVFALISDRQESLGARTLSLLPEEVPTLPINFRGPTDLQAIAGFVVGLFITESAAELAKIDPWRPGVPPFGRKLYHLRPKLDRSRQADLNRSAALRRKGARSDDPSWISHYEHVLETLNSSRYEALVVDYDGTLCDPRKRTEPLSAAIVEELTRLGDEGAVLGLATGRGASAAIELRTSLPTRLHHRVMVAYYNGAAIRHLTDRDDPVVKPHCGEVSLVVALQNDQMFSGRVRSNAVQISVGVRRRAQIEAGTAQVRLLMRENGVRGEVVASGHSIDICLVSQSKEDLVHAIKMSFGLADGPVLRIGDRGCPPGNDWRLLDDPFGLSVDEVSGHPIHCWSLAPAGMKGVQATSYYLRNLSWSGEGGRGRIRLSPASRV